MTIRSVGRRPTARIAFALAALLPAAIPVHAVDAADVESAATCSLPPAGQPIDLRQALDVGLCHDPAVRKAYARQQEQVAMLDAGAAALYPSLRGSVSRSHISKTIEYEGQPFPDTHLTGPSSDASLTMSWVLYDFGLRSESLRSTRETLAAAIAQRDQARRDSIVAIAQAFFKARYATAQAQAAAAAVARAASSVEITQAMKAGGVNSAMDLSLARSTQGQTELKRIQAESDRDAAVAELDARMGLPLTTPLSVSTADVEQVADLSQQDVARVVDAYRTVPTVVAAEHSLEAAKARESAAWADGLPTISLYGSAYRSLTPPDEATTTQREHGHEIGVRIDIPLFDGFAKSSRHAAAVAQKRQAAADLEQAVVDAQSAQWKTYQDFAVARRKLQALQGLRSGAAEADDMARGRYRAGVGSMLEVLKAQGDLADLDVQVLQAAADAQGATVALAVSLGLFRCCDQ